MLLRQEGESLIQLSHITIQICINMKLMEQAALWSYSTKPAEFTRKTFKQILKLPDSRQDTLFLLWIIKLHFFKSVFVVAG